MNILSLSKVGKEFSGETLFQNISFDINTKDNIALIGKNGTGKSTLLKMIVGDLPVELGEIHKNSKAKIGYLSQDVISSKEHSLLDEMLGVFEEVIYLEQLIHKSLKMLEEDPHNEETLLKYEKLEHNFQIQGGYDYHYKIDYILTQFGFTKEEYRREISTFSGGEKTRIAFAKLLLMNPDLLLLDEPTNHLDISIIEWLEDYLNKYNGAILVVTHDKYFINKVCRKIVEIDQKSMQIYYGTYEHYQEEKMKRYELLLKHYAHQQKEIAHLQSFVDRFRYNSKRASIAQDRVKKIERMEKMDKPTLSKRRVHMSLSDKRTTREIILEAKNLAIGYETPLLENINFTMRGYDKLAIIGPNGTGKTTLLKVMEHKLLPLSGSIEFLREYKVGYFDQNQETLNINKTIFEEIHDYYPMFTNKEVRDVAAKFLFYNDDLLKPIHILSGGEKVRLVLLLLMLSKPDLLILDEPTNHLDIETKDIIEDVFYQFNGPIIFVSHDRYFINRIGTKIVYLTTEEAVVFEGSYDQFKLQQPRQIEEKGNQVKEQYQKKTSRIDIKQLEMRIHNLEEKIALLKEELFKEENYHDKLKMEQLNSDIASLETELETLFETYYQEYESQGVIT